MRIRNQDCCNAVNAGNTGNGTTAPRNVGGEGHTGSAALDETYGTKGTYVFVHLPLVPDALARSRSLRDLSFVICHLSFIFPS